MKLRLPTSRWIGWHFLVILLLYTFSNWASSGDADWPREELSEILDISPEFITLLETVEHEYLFIDRKINTYSLRNTAIGTTITIHMDADTFKPVDIADIGIQNVEAADSLSERVGPDLRNVLLNHPDLENLEIKISYSNNISKLVVINTKQVIDLLDESPADARFSLTRDNVILD